MKGKPIVTLPQGVTQGRQAFAPDILYRCALCGDTGPAEALCAPEPIRGK